MALYKFCIISIVIIIIVIIIINAYYAERTETF